MLTFLLYGLLAVLVIGILFVAAVYFLPRGEQLAIPAPDSHTWARLPRGRIQPDDVTAMRLPVALRGYRFAETDLLLDRLTDELRARDEEIERLRNGRSAASVPPPSDLTSPTPAPGPPPDPTSVSATTPNEPTVSERPLVRPGRDAEESAAQDD